MCNYVMVALFIFLFFPIFIVTCIALDSHLTKYRCRPIYRHRHRHCRHLATREPHPLCTSGGERPGGVTQVKERSMSCENVQLATCPNTFALSFVHAISFTLTWFAASAAELSNNANNNNNNNNNNSESEN